VPWEVEMVVERTRRRKDVEKGAGEENYLLRTQQFCPLQVALGVDCCPRLHSKLMIRQNCIETPLDRHP